MAEDFLFSEDKYSTYEIEGDPNIGKDFYLKANLKKDEKQGIEAGNQDLYQFNLSREDVAELIKPYYRLDYIYGKVYGDDKLFFRSSESLLPFVDVFIGYHINYFISEARDFLINFIENNKISNQELIDIGSLPISEDVVFFEEKINLSINDRDKLKGFYLVNSGYVYFKMPDFMRQTLTSISVSRKLVKSSYKKKKKTQTVDAGEDFDIEISNYPNEMNLTFSYPINMFYRFFDQFSGDQKIIFPPYPFLRYTYGKPSKIIVVYGYMGFNLYDKIVRTVFLHKHKLSKADFQNIEEAFVREPTSQTGNQLDPCKDFFSDKTQDLGGIDLGDFIRLDLSGRENFYLVEDEEETIQNSYDSGNSTNTTIKQVNKNKKVVEDVQSVCVKFAIQPFVDFFVPDKRFYFSVYPVSVAFAGFIDKVSFKGNEEGFIELTYNCVALKDFSHKDNPVRSDISFGIEPVEEDTNVIESLESNLHEVKYEDLKRGEITESLEEVGGKLKRLYSRYLERKKQIYFIYSKKDNANINKPQKEKISESKRLVKYRDETIGSFIIRSILLFFGGLSNYAVYPDKLQRNKLLEKESKNGKISARFSDFYRSLFSDFSGSTILDDNLSFYNNYFVYTFRSFYSEDSILNYFKKPPLILLDEYRFDYYVSLFKYITQMPADFLRNIVFKYNEISTTNQTINYYQDKNLFFRNGYLGKEIQIGSQNVFQEIVKVENNDLFIKVKIGGSVFYLSVFGFLRGYHFRTDPVDGFDIVNSISGITDVFTLKKIRDIIPYNLQSDFDKMLDSFYKELISDGFIFRDTSNKISYKEMNPTFTFKYKDQNGQDQEDSLELGDINQPYFDINNPFSLYVLQNSSASKSFSFQGTSVFDDNVLNLLYLYHNIHLSFGFMVNLGDLVYLKPSTTSDGSVSINEKVINLGTPYNKVNYGASSLTEGQKLRFLSSIYLTDRNFQDLSSSKGIIPLLFINYKKPVKMLFNNLSNKEEKSIFEYLLNKWIFKGIRDENKIGIIFLSSVSLDKDSPDINELVPNELYLDCFISIDAFRGICISNFLKLKNFSSSLGKHNQYVYSYNEINYPKYNKDSDDFSDKVVFVDEYGGLEGFFQSLFRLDSMIYSELEDGNSGLNVDSLGKFFKSILESSFGILVDEKEIVKKYEYFSGDINKTTSSDYTIYYVDINNVLKEIEGSPFTDFDEYMLDVSNEDFTSLKKEGIEFNELGFKYPIRKLSDLNYSLIPTLDSYKGTPLINVMVDVVFKNRKDENVPSALKKYYEVLLKGKYDEKLVKALITSKKIKKDKNGNLKEYVQPIRFITIPVKEVPAVYLEYGEEVVEFSFEFNAGESGKGGMVKNIELARSFFAQVEIDKEAIRRTFEEAKEKGISRNQIMADVINEARTNPTELLRKYSKLVFRYNYKEGQKIVEPPEPGEARIFKLEIKLKFAIPGLKPGIYIWFDEKPVIFGSDKFRINVPNQIKGAYLVSEVRENLLTDKGIIEQTLVCVR
ncbi:MAG: hypothetical protein KatS3mg068_1501 [Candidatus Sericytochromatia bacterium]|nr:MAG: hypothetical protein KatS3mg068_1501 [Candidatus Sericytochromatia bacterium]